MYSTLCAFKDTTGSSCFFQLELYDGQLALAWLPFDDVGLVAQGANTTVGHQASFRDCMPNSDAGRRRVILVFGLLTPRDLDILLIWT